MLMKCIHNLKFQFIKDFCRLLSLVLQSKFSYSVILLECSINLLLHRFTAFLFSGAGQYPSIWAYYAEKLTESDISVHVITYPGRYERHEELAFCSAEDVAKETAKVLRVY